VKLGRKGVSRLLSRNRPFVSGVRGLFFNCGVCFVGVLFSQRDPGQILGLFGQACVLTVFCCIFAEERPYFWVYQGPEVE
jgi:hypothetical protein